MNPDKLKEEIQYLVNKKVDIETLEKRIEVLKEHFIEADPQLVASLTQKLQNGKEYQQNVVQIIEALKNNDLSGKDIDRISELIHKAKAIQIDFAELKKLESIKYIPAWIKSICGIILPKKAQANMQKKNIIDLSKELISYVDQIDPISISKKLKLAIRDIVSQEKAPAVLDKSLSEIYNKLKLVVWIRDAFDLLGKDKFSSQEVDELKKSQINVKLVEKFKSLKYKYSNFKDHIDQIYDAKEEWLTEGNTLLSEFEKCDMDSFDFDKTLNELQKRVEDHQNQINEKMEKVSEVKELYYKLQKVLEKLLWTKTVQEMVKNKEKKEIIELEILYKKSIDLKINKEWKIFEGFEELYGITQSIQLSTEKIRKSREQIKNSSYSKEKALHLFFQNNMSKITFAEAKQLKEQIELLEDKINVKGEMEEMEQDIQKCNQFDNDVNDFIVKYHQVLNKEESEISKEEFLQIEDDMHLLNEKLFLIPIHLDQKEKDLFLFEWCIVAFQHLLGFKKSTLEQWGQLFASSKLLAAPNQNMLERIAAEIQHFQKLQSAVQELKSKEKLDYQERTQKAKELRNITEVQNVKKGLENCLIECESEIMYVKNLIDLAEEKIEQYQEQLSQKDKQSQKFFKEYLKSFRESLPFAVDEEFQIEEYLEELEYIKQEYKKSNQDKQKLYKIIQRYRISKISIKDLETLNKQFKEKEDILENISQTLSTFNDTQDLISLSFEQCVKYEDQLQNELMGELNDDRIIEVQDNLFIQKLKVLELMWEQEKELDNYELSYKDIYSLFQQTDKKIKEKQSQQEDDEIYNEDGDQENMEERLQKGGEFLKKVIQQCDKKLKQIKEIENIKQLDNLIKNEEHCFFGFVSLKSEMNTIREELHQKIKREKELKRQLEEEKLREQEELLKQQQKKKQLQEKKNKKQLKYREEEQEQDYQQYEQQQQQYEQQEDIEQDDQELLIEKSIKIKQKLKKLREKGELSQREEEFKITLKKKLKEVQQLQQEQQQIKEKKIKKHQKKEIKLVREYQNLEKKEKERQKQLQEQKDKISQRQKILKLKQKIESMKIKQEEEQRYQEQQKIRQKHLKQKKQKEQQLKNLQMKNKIVSDLSNAISNIQYFDYSIDESITVAKRILKNLQIFSIDNITMENQTSFQELQTSSQQTVQVLENIQYYENICYHIKQNNFDFKYLQALVGKSDTMLEQEDNKLSMNVYFDKQNKDFLGSKIHKKSKKNTETNQDQLQDINNNRLLTTSSQFSTISHNNLGKQSVVAGKQSTSWKQQGIDQMDLRKQDLIAKKSIQKLVDRKSSIKNFSNYKQQQNSQQQNRRRKQYQFSDDEDYDNDQQFNQFNQNNEVQMMTQEDYDQFKEIMKAEQTKFQQKIARIPTMYDPDQQQQNQNQQQIQAQLQQQQQEQQDGGEEETTFQMASLDFDSENFFFDSLKIMSMHSLEDLERLPMTTNLPMKIQGKLQDFKVQEYVLSIIKAQETNPRDIIISAGWLESMNSEQQESLNEYAMFLNSQKKIGVVEWTSECKLYLLHTNQIPQEWFDQANFAVLSQLNQQCYLQFLCIYKAYKDTNNTEQKKLNIVKVQVQNNNMMDNSIELTDQEENNTQQLQPQQNNLGVVLGGDDSQVNQKIQELNQLKQYVPRKNTSSYIMHRKMEKYFGKPNRARKPNLNYLARDQQQYEEDDIFSQLQQQKQQFSAGKRSAYGGKPQKMTHDQLYEQWQLKQQNRQIKKQQYRQFQNQQYNNNNQIQQQQGAINIQEDYQNESSQEQTQYLTDEEIDSIEEQYFQNKQQEYQQQQQLQLHQQLQKYSTNKSQQYNNNNNSSYKKRKRSFSQQNQYNNNNNPYNHNRPNKRLFMENQQFEQQQQQYNNMDYESQEEDYFQQQQQVQLEQEQLKQQQQELQQTILRQQQEIQKLTQSVKKSVQKQKNKQQKKQQIQSAGLRMMNNYYQQNNQNNSQQQSQQQYENILQPQQQVMEQQMQQAGSDYMPQQLKKQQQKYSQNSSQQLQQSQSQQQYSQQSQQQQQYSQQSQQQANTTFLRTRENSVESTVSRASNIIPISNIPVQKYPQQQQQVNNNFQQKSSQGLRQMPPQQQQLQQQNNNNNKLRNSFLIDKEISNSQVDQQRLKMFRI